MRISAHTSYIDVPARGSPLYMPTPSDVPYREGQSHNPRIYPAYINMYTYI